MNSAPALEAAPRRALKHYLLFGPNRGRQWYTVLLARRYITRFGTAFGFSVEDALCAEQVTIVGDTREVGLEIEARLKRAGVRVERWLGDLYTLELILADRLGRGAP